MMVPPAGTADVPLRKVSMKSSASGLTGVKALVWRKRQALQQGGQVPEGATGLFIKDTFQAHNTVSFDIVRCAAAHYIRPKC
jgi:hypothetical protein